MLLTQPPECRSRLANLVHNFFFTHKVVVHILLHTFLLHQVCLAVTDHGVLIFNFISFHAVPAAGGRAFLSALPFFSLRFIKYKPAINALPVTGMLSYESVLDYLL